MSQKLAFILALILAAFMLQTTTAGQTLPPAIQWIPQDAVIVLELSEPRALLEVFTNDKATAAVMALPLYKEQASKPQFKEFLNIINFVEVTLDTDWRTGLAKLTGGGITFAVCPEDTVLLIIDAEDEHMLERLHEFFLNIARAEAEKKGQSNQVASTEYDGVKAWTFNGEEAHAIIGKRLVFANRSEGLKAVLKLRAEAKGASLVSNTTYQAAKRAAGPDVIATVFTNLKPLMQLPKVARLLEQQRNNPLAALSFAGIVEAVRDSNWLALGLHVEDSKLVFRASVDGKTVAPTSPAAFALPNKSGEGVLPNVSVPRRIAALSLYRDLHQFYAAKDDLFPDRTSGLIFFENMMGIFFSGRDLTSEVLAETKPEIRIVVAEQEYEPAMGTPQIKLPAFAAILRLRRPEQFNEVAEEAWQKAVGLINFTRGQQALPGLIIGRPIQGETQFTVAAFSTAEIEDKTKLDQRFNYRPALAMPGEYLILSSTDGLARDLIDALGRETEHTVKPLAQTHSLVEIDAAQLASILEANRETLVRSGMVKKGSTQEESETEIDMLITVVKFVDHVKLSIGTHEALTQARLEMKLNWE
ncbi:MAG TPA: hypothetical protein VMW72_06055 [Sedimentisphaerales bacterium]|nr:hypothetical protein [Sedimentisphaerales bacterium]